MRAAHGDDRRRPSEPGRQLVLPQLYYERLADAVEWLCRVFSFTEASRLTGRDGGLRLADLRSPGGGAVLVSSLGGPVQARARASLADFRQPDERPWPELAYSITVLVPDVDQHHEHARREGALIITLPADRPWGLREYEALDIEGRQWNFAQHLRSVSPADWGSTTQARS